MTRERRLSTAILFVALVASGVGCELIADVDRSKVSPTGSGGEAGQGGTGGLTTTTTTTGGGGVGGTGGTGGTGGVGGVGGVGGTGGTGGSVCVPEDDNNECTDDVCNQDGTTSHFPSAAGNPCTTGGTKCDGNGACVECFAPDECPGVDDACQTRTCIDGACGFDFAPAGTALPVQDAGDCKKAVCDGMGATVAENDDIDLPDDSNACTDDLCTAGVASNPAKPQGTSCGTAGNGDPLVCDAAGVCVGCNAPSDCPGTDDECKTRTCENNTCGVTFTAQGTPVAAQTAGDCVEQVCDGSGNIVASDLDSDVPPDDGNECTDDTCAAGAPVHPAKGNGTSCDDGDACTQADSCQSGACGGSPVVCTALDTCHTAGTCDPATGMCSNPVKPNGAACNDGNACTLVDTCQAGACSGGMPKVCTALDQCHVAGTCDPGTGVCSNPNKADGTTCTDGNACTTGDACQSGTCTSGTPKVCTALDQCHVAGACNTVTGLCSNPNKPNGTSCNDSNACTQTDACQNGTCTGGNPVVCTAQDQCHAVGTCDPGTGVCSNPNKPDGASCDDSDACTQTDTCQAGACSGGNPVVCTALDTCHVPGTCDSATGMCSNPVKPDGSSCSDGDACTQTDTCTAGTCNGSNPVVCTALDVCHVPGTCNPGTGVCSNPNQVDGTPCMVGPTIGACANGVCGACGDGVQQAGELCDDGNFVSGDGCDTNCTPSACGNGITAGAEQCDDANAVNGDGCDNNCTLTGCGNGVLTGAELCDDGNLVNGDGCDNNCSVTGCGNGIATGAEACDDGNATNGDGCDNNCTASACGNGIVAGAEACDDGNLLGNDGCGAKCQTEAPYTCTGSPSVCTSTVEINCGDGVDNDGDSNIDCADTDCALGCNANVGPCAAGEALLVYTATDTPKPVPDATPAGATSNITVGGFGLVKRVVMQTNITHTYDADIDATLASPGNVVTDVTSDNGSSLDNYTDTIFNTACATSITAGTAPFTGCFKPEAPFTVYSGSQAKGVWAWKVADDAAAGTGTINSWRLALCVAQSTCGDGAADPGEACDDGNAVSGDACDPNCTLPACGNGAVGTGETCDDGNLADGDGCDSNCKPTGCGNGVVTAGETCDDGNTASGDGCDVNCTPTGCGNGAVSAGETCDDGNLAPSDGCDATCALETGFVCLGTPNVCAAQCGNSVINAPESCDDGNFASSDGCSSSCQTEATYTEVEPNGTTAEADTAAGAGVQITGQSTMISGAITPTGDKDLFKMTLAQAGVVRMETFDSSGNDCTSGNIPAAMKITLLSSAGTTILADTATAGIGFCSALVLYLNAGTYYVQVEKSTAGTIAAYKLQVAVHTDRGSESEVNETIAQADGFPGSDVYIFGGHQVAADFDVFAINVPAGRSIRAETIEGGAETCESNGVDSRIRLFSPAGVDLGNDSDAGRGFCSLIDGTGTSGGNAYARNLAGGTYYLRIEAHTPSSNTAAMQFDYRLVVTVR